MFKYFFLEYIHDCGIILAVTAFSAIVLATMNFFLAVNKKIWVPKKKTSIDSHFGHVPHAAIVSSATLFQQIQQYLQINLL